MSRDGGPIGESGRWQSGATMADSQSPALESLVDRPVVMAVCSEVNTSVRSESQHTPACFSSGADS